MKKGRLIRIGNYFISDWEYQKGIWTREICGDRDYITFPADIRLQLLIDLEDRLGVEIDFLYKFPKDEYHSMYGPNAQLQFPTLKAGKERIDSFLNKLSKLKAFI